MQMPSVRERGAVLAVASILAVAGCGGSSDASDTNGPAATVLVSDPTNASMQALFEGKLEVVGGCLGAVGTVVVWPPGTKVVDKDPLSITVPGSGTFAIGDQVKVGGGYIHEPPNDPGPAPVKVGSIDVPPTCAEHKIFLAGPNDF